ncbi:MAG: sulfatase [Gemmataceae bacterium]
MRFVALFAAVAFLASPSHAQTKQKHVLLLIADDLGMEVGCYGHPVVQTPHLDRLAKKGVRFTKAYSTVASCSPSRAAIFTGLFSHQNGMYGLHHAAHSQQSHAWVQSLANLLRAGGYWTGIIDKVHVGPTSVYDWETIITKGTGRDNVAIARHAKDFFTQRKDRPFFLTVGFVDPHRAAVGFGNEPFAKDPAEIRYDPAKVVVPPHLPDNAEVRKDLAEYYQSVSRLDRGVGLVLKELEDVGLLDDTLIIFISDNGIPFPGAKTTLYEAGIHLPLIMSSPGHRNGGTHKGLASWIDLAPTILDYAKVKGPKYALPGQSLMPVLGKETSERESVFGSHQMHEITMPYPMRTIVTQRWKLVVNLDHQKDFPFASDLWSSPSWQSVRAGKLKTMGQKSVESFLRRPKEELYDLENDPNELKNVAANSEHETVLRGLRTRLRQWQADTKDPWQIVYREEDASFNKK